MIFSVTYYLQLYILISFFTINEFLFQVKMLMFYKVQITNSTFVGKKWDVQ